MKKESLSVDFLRFYRFEWFDEFDCVVGICERFGNFSRELYKKYTIFINAMILLGLGGR